MPSNVMRNAWCVRECFLHGRNSHARMLLSGIQTDDWQFTPVGHVDSRHALSAKRGRARRKRAGMTGRSL